MPETQSNTSDAECHTSDFLSPLPINSKFILRLLLQDMPGKSAPEQSAVLDFMLQLEVLLALSPRANPVFNSTGWYDSRQQCKGQGWRIKDELINSDLQDFMPDAIPVATIPINLGLGLIPQYIGYIPQWLGSVQLNKTYYTLPNSNSADIHNHFNCQFLGLGTFFVYF